MAVKFDSLLAKLRDGSMQSSSKFNLFNEDKQNLSGNIGIQRFKYEYKKKARLLFPLMLAVPFNPETGEVDEEFNPNHKWRTLFAASDAAIVLKGYSNENPKTKEAFMRRAGAKEWDTSDLDNLNRLDKKILKQYRVPTISSTYVIQINEPRITGNEYAINYLVDVELDVNTGEFKTEIPIIAKIGEIYKDLAFAEIKELTEARELNNPALYRGNRPLINGTSISSLSDKDFKQAKSSIWQSIPIGTIQPLNYVLGFAFNLNPKTATMLTDDKNQSEEFSSDPQKVAEHRIFMNYAKKYKNYITTTIEEEVNDVFFDFIEADIIDQQSSQPSTDLEKMQAAKDITPSRPSSSLWNVDEEKFRFSWCEEFVDGVRQTITESEDFEKKVKRLIAKTTNRLTDEVTEAARGFVQSNLPLNHIYLSDSLCLRHRDTLFYIYGQAFNKELIRRGLLELDEKQEGKEESKPKEIEEKEALEQEMEEAQVDMDLEMEEINL